MLFFPFNEITFFIKVLYSNIHCNAVYQDAPLQAEGQ